ncbi:peptidoglycan-binding domain-containing protein [Streptomyces subrutilus]|nr:peptidoglycan-binding protein [Streptomyces subrutilus]
MSQMPVPACPSPAPPTGPTAPPVRPRHRSGRATGPAAPPAGAGTLRPGDGGAEVRALQERLQGQGFTYVSVTGLYDDRTRRGAARLQSDRGITGDPEGVYGPATRAAFG